MDLAWSYCRLVCRWVDERSQVPVVSGGKDSCDADSGAPHFPSLADTEGRHPTDGAVCCRAGPF